MLQSLTAQTAGTEVVVTARYAMPEVEAALTLNYRVNQQGGVTVTQSLKATAGAKHPPMMRFGMRMEMAADYDAIRYYGRGPAENYIDRKASTFVGRYAQSVEEQFYPYIRPQETGTKSDLRWWHQGNRSGQGLLISAEGFFSASALHYALEMLDDGVQKDQRHSSELTPDEQVYLCIDGAQMGLGCENSWGAWPLPAYRLPYGDYTFTFRLEPCRLLE